MTRVLVVHSGNMYGGVERVLETFAQSSRLGANIHPSFALCFEGQLSRSLRALGHAPHIIGPARLTRPYQILRARARLARVLRDQRVDVVVTQSSWAHVIFAPVVRRHRLPLVMWVHDVLSGTPWLERLASRHVPDLLIANSTFTLRAARRVFPDCDGQVIHYPLLFAHSRGERPEVRAQHQTPDDTLVISMVARMEPYKGHRVLLEALTRLPSDRPWICWLIGGAQRPFEHKYELDLRNTVARSLPDRVRFLGFQSDVMSLLGASDLFCHPNRDPEAFGISIVEALHAGLPVVASDVGGPAEILTSACGVSIPAGDAAALAKALSLLLESSATRHAMSKAGPARALELCDPIARLHDLTETLGRVGVRSAA